MQLPKPSSVRVVSQDAALLNVNVPASEMTNISWCSCQALCSGRLKYRSFGYTVITSAYIFLQCQRTPAIRAVRGGREPALSALRVSDLTRMRDYAVLPADCTIIRFNGMIGEIYQNQNLIGQRDACSHAGCGVFVCRYPLSAIGMIENAGILRPE